MKTTTKLLTASLFLALAGAAGSIAGEAKSGAKEACCAADAAKASGDACCASHEQSACAEMWSGMKGLVGAWESSDADKDGKADVNVTYRLTSNGSALVETLFPGQDHEMVTIYTMEGENMVVTHYCAMGNQPRLRSTAESKPGHIVFAFEGGTNVDPKGDFMGALTFDIVDENTIKHDWKHFKAGAQTEEGLKVELKRAAKNS